ncbi:hypothetical protein BCR37DRAFT_390882 [Protomyces lactucae-debilis]|uniref:Uncharacterized protein n=1 Tax=Protomyces lactucae-debilis TaxID=2754530 RepID=A0A1Y2FSD0_PROLT|nr:uncharacterized protein BCR37DRAFT_390882 [Protomyces lactucae-debilis]ORY86086.1 hypothetical protein BCR37DRAFT_390882 [Protomyces lactucae-debilis]
MPTLENALIRRARTDKPFQQIVTTWSVVLMGCDRFIRVNFFFNRLTNCRASGSTVTHLQHWLRQTLGQTAVGIKVGDVIYKSDEQMMRENVLKSNEAYHVVYEDYTPSYSVSIESPPLYTRMLPQLPGYNDETGIRHCTPTYFEEWVYYTAIPLVCKTIDLKLSFGRKVTIELNNKQTAFRDNFRNALILSAGYKAQGIALDDGTVLTSDAILFDPRVENFAVYRVVYGSAHIKALQVRPPSADTHRHSARARHSRESARDSLRRISTSTSRTLHRVASSTSRNSAQLVRMRADKRQSEITTISASC